VGAEGKLAVEVHWRLDDPERVGRLPVDELWARAAPWSVGGEPALRLEVVDATMHLCRHAMVQNLGRLGLKPVCDLAHMVAGWNEAEWEALGRRAVDYGLARAVYLMLVLAEQIMGVTAPLEVMEMLYPPGRESLPPDLAQRFLGLEAQPAMNMPGTAVRAWSQGSVFSRLAYLWRHVVLSRDGMAALYKVQARSPRIWLTYLWRPVDLLRRYGKAAWRTARGNRAAQGAWQREMWLERWLGETKEA
jgi:hypothetical protein